jgi:enoyl-CoA hydratase/carnithine racemase
MAYDFETILFEKSPDKVATVTINRPQAMNSFTGQMCKEFRELWTTVAEDDEINTVVLRAAPGRAFSSGADVRGGGGGPPPKPVALWNQRDPGEMLGPKQNFCWKPVVCAVHGLCGGGAFYWVNESDIVICSPEAEFFDPHVTYGMTAALEPIGLRWRIPVGDVLRMALMGNDERMSAETALRVSLVSEIVERERLWDRAHELAAIIAAKPTSATQGTARAIWESMDQTRNASLQTAMKYCLLGNAIGTKEVSRDEIMGQKKVYSLR